MIQRSLDKAAGISFLRLMGALPAATIVVPCYNEASRLVPDDFLALATKDGVRVLFVDDGSTDDTASVLRAICERAAGRAELLSLPANAGKAEAVRQGLLRACAAGAAIVGYADADLSTPVRELLRLLDVCRDRGVAVVMGARVALSGLDIERSRVRHYLGRVFASAASIILQARIYDTQCGAKFFQVSDNLRSSLTEPFSSRWAFDVQLLGRLLTGAPGIAPITTDDIVEVPLEEWRDVAGSKVKLLDMVRVLGELGVIWSDLTKRRRRMSREPR